MALSTGASSTVTVFFLFHSFYVISNFVDNNHQVGGLSVFFWCVLMTQNSMTCTYGTHC